MKHLADHRQQSGPARLQHYLRLDRNHGETAWRGLWQKPQHRSGPNRRVVEFARIERGRLA